MSTVLEISDFQTMQFEEVTLLFDKQKAYFATDVTKAYDWRVDQLDRLIRMLKDNYERFSDASRKDFKTAAQENVLEVSASIATAEYTKSQLKGWMNPVEAPLPKFLAASGHKGVVFVQWVWTYLTGQRGSRLIVNHRDSHGPERAVAGDSNTSTDANASRSLRREVLPTNA